MTANDPAPENERLARIETALALLVKQLDDKLPALEARTNRLERVMWVALGMAIAAGAPNYVQLLT